MDYVTRRFVGLSKQFIRLTKKLQKGLTSLHRDLEKYTESIHKQVERQNQNQHAQNRLLKPPLRVNAETHETEAAQTENRSRHNRNLGVQILLTVGTWAAFAAAAYYAGIAKNQLREMILVRGQTKHAIEMASRSAAAAESANADAAEHFSQDQRPYIGLYLALEPPAGQQRSASNAGSVLNLYHNPKNSAQWQIVWSIHYKNFGKSPALSVRTDKAVEVGNNAFQRWHWTKLDDFSGTILQSGQDVFVSAPSKPISEQDAKDDIAGDFRVVLFGHIEYQGLDGRSYWTEFCIQQLATGATAFCPSHNLMQ
jgi:hypothetical protein